MNAGATRGTRCCRCCSAASRWRLSVGSGYGSWRSRRPRPPRQNSPPPSWRACRANRRPRRKFSALCRISPSLWRRRCAARSPISIPSPMAGSTACLHPTPDLGSAVRTCRLRPASKRCRRSVRLRWPRRRCRPSATSRPCSTTCRCRRLARPNSPRSMRPTTLRRRLSSARAARSARRSPTLRPTRRRHSAPRAAQPIDLLVVRPAASAPGRLRRHHGRLRHQRQDPLHARRDDDRGAFGPRQFDGRHHPGRRACQGPDPARSL